MATQETLPEPRAELRAAKRKNRELRQLREARRIECINNALMEGCEFGGYGGGGFGPNFLGDYYQLIDRFSSQFRGATNLNDRRYGRNGPWIYLNEIDVQVARMASRMATSVNNYGIGILEAWTSYMVGEGTVRTVQPKPGNEELVPKPILAKLQGVIDDVADRIDWDGGERPGLEEEMVKRPEIDGAGILCLHEDDDGQPCASTIECEQLTAPPGADLDYMFGILNEKNNPQKPAKFWLRPIDGEAQEGSEYDAEQIVYVKTNVMRQMKVGFPTFSFSMNETVTLADELRQALGIGAKVQAGIAGVRQWATATADQVQALMAGIDSYTQQAGPGGMPIPVGRSFPGEIQDVPKGQQWVNPPNATNAAAHVSILHACLRGATVRYNMPDFIGSGDASANTFDNSVAIGSLFGRRIIREQKRPAAVARRIFWWALDTRCTRAGDIVAVGPDGTVHRMPWEQLKTLVEIKVTPASPQERDKDKEAARLVQLVAAKLTSPQQAIKELGEDVEETFAEIEEFAKRFPAPVEAPGAKGEGKPGEPKAAAEPPIAATPPKTVQPTPEPQTVRESLNLTVNVPPAAVPLQESLPADADAGWVTIPAGVLKLLEPAAVN